MFHTVSFLLLTIGAPGDSSDFLPVEEKRKTFELAPDQIFIPKGFDDNDTPQFIYAGEFPNNCYRVDNTRAELKNGQIIFGMTAFKYPGACIESTTAYYDAIDIHNMVDGVDKPLEEGDYPIWNTKKHDKPMGVLHIHHTDSPKRDDFNYAPINSSVVFFDANSQRSVLIVFGLFTDSCQHVDIEKSRVMLTGKNLIEVLPILQDVEEGAVCKKGDHPFQQKLMIPESIPAGRYMFHIRTANGHSFNKFDLVQRESESDGLGK
ncbi:MAG: hypothetical protein JWQ35_2677 [Bacteriovoracaceae bacterium]|nr:hypothetical protein [Bacteriovoracaceae bacterium]